MAHHYVFSEYILSETTQTGFNGKLVGDITFVTASNPKDALAKLVDPAPQPSPTVDDTGDIHYRGFTLFSIDGGTWWHASDDDPKVSREDAELGDEVEGFAAIKAVVDKMVDDQEGQ